MPQPRRVKAADVAREAEVSTATVSYVLNKTPGQTISETTAQRVREAARRLGYVGNPAAQTLARGKSNFVLLDMSDFVTQESATLAAAPLLTKLRNEGYEPFMTWWPDGLDGFTRADRMVRFARATSPEAVISVLPLPEELQTSLRSVGARSISSIAKGPEDLAPALSMSAKTQVEYLAERGHTHALYVASTQPALDHVVELRDRVGAQTAAAHGMAWTALPRYESVPELAESIVTAMKDHPKATAIAAYNDTDALAALFALHMLQVEIPTRMAVIGIDNDRFADLSYPKLTSVSFDFDLSEADPGVLTAAIESEGRTGVVRDYHRIIRPRVHVRESA